MQTVNADLTDCRTTVCGRVNCLEACWSGIRRRRLQELLAIYDLLQKSAQPLIEVQVVRDVWRRPFGHLNESSIAAAKQLSRRALDRLYDYKLVAVGTFRASPEIESNRWICETHLIVVPAAEPLAEYADQRPPFLSC
jgi:hypothetical protein